MKSRRFYSPFRAAWKIGKTLLSVVFFAGPLHAGADTPDAFQFFQEEAKVVTASRREQPIEEVPLAVDVITPADIKASGATSLSDLLRFRVGMDVVDGRSVDGNRSIVAVRGFPSEFVGNLQILVDGRSVYQPIESGVYWDQLPVQLQDVERIEIIRGTNAALYGTGASLGVINIITKKPQGPTEATVQTYGGSQGTVQSAEALQSVVGPVDYRLSTTYRESNGYPTPQGDSGNDFQHFNKANIRTDWKVAEGSDLSFFGGRTWNHDGVPDAQAGSTHFNQDFEMLKFAQHFGPHSTVEILSSRNDFEDDLPPSGPTVENDERVLQFDEEILHRIDGWNSRLNTTYGLSYRNATATSAAILGPHPQREDLWNGYFNQTVHLLDSWTLSGAVSWEGTNIGPTTVVSNYQAASLWSPWENQIIRTTYAVAHTIPSLIDVAAEITLAPTVRLIGNPNLTPEKLTTYEVGYRSAAIQKRLQMDSSLYYTTIDPVSSLVTQSITFTPGPSVTETFGNTNQAVARGSESEIKYQFSRTCSLFMNYTYEHVSDSQGNLQDLTENTPAHKFNVGGITDWGHGFSGSLNVGYKDHYFIGSEGRGFAVTVPAYWRLDARLAYAVNPHLELFLAGQNLAASTHLEFADGLVVPRTYQGGMTLTFGPFL